MRWIGCDTIYGVDNEHDTPYMTRVWIGRLRLHIFHRGDADEDCHDHPWGFWTFPFVTYIEEVLNPNVGNRHERLVRAWRWHRREATFAHRVICPWGDGEKIVTVVWRDKSSRKWGFWKQRDGKTCWVPWRKYCFEGGKHGPCE